MSTLVEIQTQHFTRGFSQEVHTAGPAQSRRHVARTGGELLLLCPARDWHRAATQGEKCEASLSPAHASRSARAEGGEGEGWGVGAAV